MARRSTALSVRTVRAAAPVIRIAAPRAIAVRAPKRRRSSSRKSGGGMGGDPLQAAMWAGGYGLLVKSGLLDKLPTIPMLGRTGSVAVLAYLWAKHGGGGQMARRVAVVAATIAGYQLGSAGSISGDEGDGYAVTSGDDDDE